MRRYHGGALGQNPPPPPSEPIEESADDPSERVPGKHLLLRHLPRVHGLLRLLRPPAAPLDPQGQAPQPPGPPRLAHHGPHPLPPRQRPRRPQALLVLRPPPHHDLVGLHRPPDTDPELPPQRHRPRPLLRKPR